MHHISNLYLPCRGRTEPFSQLTINAARAIRLSRPGKGADSGELTEQFRTRRRANEAFWIFLGYKTCSQRPFAKTRMLHQGREEIDIMSRALDFEAIQRFDLPVNGLFAGVCISDQLGDHWEIGSESCRESVCPYV